MRRGRSAIFSYVRGMRAVSRLPRGYARRVTEAIRVFALLEGIGLAALPLAARGLSRLPGRGLGMAKPLGLLLLGWLVRIGGRLGIPNGLGLAIAGAVVLAGLGLLARRRSEPDPFRRRAWICAEVVFAVAF